MKFQAPSMNVSYRLGFDFKNIEHSNFHFISDDKDKVFDGKIILLDNVLRFKRHNTRQAGHLYSVDSFAVVSIIPLKENRRY